VRIKNNLHAATLAWRAAIISTFAFFAADQNAFPAPSAIGQSDPCILAACSKSSYCCLLHLDNQLVDQHTALPLPETSRVLATSAHKLSLSNHPTQGAVQRLSGIANKAGCGCWKKHRRTGGYGNSLCSNFRLSLTAPVLG